MTRLFHLAALAVSAAAFACTTPAATTTPTPATTTASSAASASAGGDVDAGALCQVKAEIDDAASRLKLAELRTRLEKDAAKDRAAQFGAMLTIANEQDRFHAFHDDTAAHPQSAVGPLGECFVYAAWKMSDQAMGRCQMAADRMKGAAIVDVARAELNRRKGSLDQAQALVDGALAADAGCAAALIEAARVQQAKNEADKALASWQRALQAWPKCYLCAVEAAKLVEQAQGKQAAVSLWEQALALQPDAPEALKRYGAALAGSDDKKALDAYEKAIAAGQNDVATFMGASQLAVATGDVDKAQALAEQAAKVQPNEIDAWRLILSLAQKKNDPVKAAAAAKEILRLVDEDLPALLVLGRDARKSGDLVQAVLRYDVASRAIAAGRTGALSAPELETFKTENAQLLNELKVSDKPAKGTANGVVYSVQQTVQSLFVDRLRKKKGMKGSIEVAVVVSAAGTVDDVEITKDTLGDPPVTASVVANLRRASITGGAKRYSFQMDFQ